jgi:hypothetical protein
MRVFHLSQEPVKEGAVEIRQRNCSGSVDRRIQRELRSFNKIENDRVFHSDQRVPDAAQVKGGFRVQKIQGHDCNKTRNGPIEALAKIGHRGNVGR